MLVNRFYLIDDDISTIKILENLIEDEEMGDVCGYSTDGRVGLEDIMEKRPDILIVDLLMPEIDGIEVALKAKKIVPSIKIIMISQVSSKNMIAKAYEAGIEFFINKPINRIEVKKIISTVLEKMDMEHSINAIKSMLGTSGLKKEQPANSEIRNIKLVLSKIGIIGEKGADEIVNICEYLIQKGETSLSLKVQDVCLELSDNPKTMEQRIRRAINKGLSNIANIGIEDYMNETFIRYSNTIYDFENVKAQMDYIRGKRKTGGTISVKKFIDNLMLFGRE